MSEPANTQPESKSADWEYIRLAVSRSEWTEIYLKVPKGWRPSGRDYKLIGQATKETVSDHDWDNYGWENSVDVQEQEPVNEEEANLYKVFDAIPHLLKQESKP